MCLNSDLFGDLQADNNLRGRLPVEIGLLTELQVLDVRNNQIQESIPDSMHNMSQLGKSMRATFQKKGVESDFYWI